MVGVIFSGGDGIAVNVFFDLFISVALITGLFIHKLGTYPKTSYKKRAVYLYALIFLISFSLTIFAKNEYIPIENLQSEEKITLSDVSFIKTHKGNTLCETIVLCYFAKKPFSYDPFLTNVFVKEGILNETDLTNLLKEKKFSLIQLEPLSYYYGNMLTQGNERFSDDFLSKLNMYYYLKYKSELGAYFVPKQN